jgi:hypothetical protein
MQFDQTAVIEMSANRFELIIPWKQAIDKEWAMREFADWLNNRLDLTRTSVYDGGIPAKGDEHA